MIQTLPCPNCHRILVLTAEASMQAVLRCRHCSNQFVLGEMVEAQLGFWEVVDDPNAPEAKIHVAGEVVANDTEIELAKSEEYVSPQMLLKTQAEKRGTDRSKFQPISHEQYERVRRKGKSPIWSVLSVLLGGLASIPIATLLIWHVLGKDPLQMGPSVARYAPWIVPTRFRPRKFDKEILPPAPIAGASGFPRFDNIMNSSETTAAPSDEEPSAEGLSAARPTVAHTQASQGRDRRAPRAMSSQSGFLVERLPADEVTAVSPPAAEIPSKDLFSIIGEIEKDLEAFNEPGEDRERQKKLALQIYSNLASLALAINQLPAASPLRRLVRTELQSVGQEVAQHIEVQQLIQSGSRFWLTNHREDLIGLAVVIHIGSIVEVDNTWRVTPKAPVGEESLQIIVPKDIFSSLSEGQSILAIGCLTRSTTTENLEPADAALNSTSMLTANYIYALEP